MDDKTRTLVDDLRAASSAKTLTNKWLFTEAADTIEAQAKRIEEQAARIEELEKVLKDAVAHLAGAAAAYRKHAARSTTLKPRAVADAFFTTRSDDFDKATERGRRALTRKEVK